MHFNEALSRATTERTTRALAGAQAADSERHRRECLRERETGHDATSQTRGTDDAHGTRGEASGRAGSTDQPDAREPDHAQAVRGVSPAIPGRLREPALLAVPLGEAQR